MGNGLGVSTHQKMLQTKNDTVQISCEEHIPQIYIKKLQKIDERRGNSNLVVL